MRLITLIMLLIGCIARADTFAVEPEQTTDALYPYILYLEDTDRILTIDDVMNEPAEAGPRTATRCSTWVTAAQPGG